MSREYNHDYSESIQNKYRDIFTFEDKYKKVIILLDIG